MKRTPLLLLTLVTLGCFAQDPDAKTLQETSKNFIKQGDYANAALVLNRALQQQPDNTDLQKDLAFTYYLQQNYARALEIVTPLLEKKTADVQTYQVAALIYKAKEDAKECEKLYKRGLKAFPASGPLYSEYGELLWGKQNYTAIQQWEKGIEADPNYAGNYYHAARYYYFTKDKVWSLIYGEIFVNMESYSRRTLEIKNLLLDSYSKLFTEADLLKDQDTKNEFSVIYLNNMNRQSVIAAMGITPASLTMIRTRFVLDWFVKDANKYPYRLFEYHRQLLKEGLFDAYNQWLFGSVQNLTAFQYWTNTHDEEYKEFTRFQQGRVFKLPAAQHYKSKTTTGR